MRDDLLVTIEVQTCNAVDHQRDRVLVSQQATSNIYLVGALSTSAVVDTAMYA
jgi:hypothetical protein